MIKFKLTNNTSNGITLIALVITIIVLLILAGVTIATLTGDNGILTKANEAKIETEKAEEDELRRLTALEASTNIENTTHKDNSTGEEKTVTIPAGFAVSQIEGENTLKNGLVVIDENGNSWVWIEVPEEIFVTAKSDIDYDNIQNDLKNYTSYKSSTWNDKWYDVNGNSEDDEGALIDNREGCGLTLSEYNNLLKKMYSSIYNNHGFWISQYEVGTNVLRNSQGDELSMPVSRKGAYLYNYVTCAQAQEVATKMKIKDETTSLMFGIQWDLVLQSIKEKGSKTQEELEVDSTTWGNNKDSVFWVEDGKYSLDEGLSYINTGGFQKDGRSILFTTGITYRNSVLNIYDLAGNVWERTLEKSPDIGLPATYRGGSMDNNSTVIARARNSAIVSSGMVGFRCAMY